MNQAQTKQSNGSTTNNATNHSYYQKLSLITFSILLSTTLLSTAILSNVHTYADDTLANDTPTDKVTITVESACTFTGEVPSGKEHTATIIPGQITSDIGTTNMTAICNDPSGYDIYAVGYTNNTWKNNNLSATISGTEYTIPTGTTTSGTSSWSMKLAAGTGDAATIVTTPINYSTYAPVPGDQDTITTNDDYQKVAYYPSSTTGASGSSLTSTYQVYTTAGQIAGTYTGQVKYTLVHPNGAEAPEAADPKIYMQNATSAQCGSTMYDNRDAAGSETAYTTAKIGDLCWMTTNLNLAGGTQLSHDNTNVPEGYSTTTAGFTNGDTLPASSTTGFRDNATAYVYNSNSATCGDDQPCYSYYSWRAATAGYNTTIDGTSVNYDICPSSWRLPTSAELTTLKNTYTTGNTLTAAPFLAVYGGNYLSDSFWNEEVYGAYWSSTAYSYSLSYILFFESDSASVEADDANKNIGFPVRCVAQE